MKLGFLQYDVVRDAERNIALLKKYLERERCDLLLLPELSLCGYLFKSREEIVSCAENVPCGPSTQKVMALSKQYNCTIIFGLAEKEDGRVFNTAVVVSRGSYIGKYRKIHLTDFEKKFFDRGAQNTVFAVEGTKIGVQICFDAWFPEISREQIRMGAKLLCVPANFGGETTCHIAQIRAVENVTPLVLCNRTGNESVPGMDASFLGKSSIINASGETVCAAPANTETFGSCSISPAEKRANIICSDFDAEMAFHYQRSCPSNTHDSQPL